MLRMNGSALAGLDAPDTRRDLRTECCVLRGQRTVSVVQAGANVTHSAYSGWVRDQKPTHILPSKDRRNGGGSVVMGMIWARLRFPGAGFPKKDKVCGG
jgi:hypothetical protein